MKNSIVVAMLLALPCAAAASDTVAVTILAEARGEGKSGMYAVACVIQTRSRERRLTPEQVCLQKYQFSCNNKGIQVKLLNQSQEADYARLLAAAIGRLDESFVGGANHYHAAAVAPKWSKGVKPVKEIGNHKFYKL